ncbi:MAG: Ig-like domain-containing protein, partial [bacterium]|nr:Ig-like domain-containing protein [bacterium]
TTGLKDLSDPGNNMASDTTWSFTTADTLEVVLNSPNGGQNWTGNTAHDIVYTISGGASLYTANLYYSTDGGANYAFIGSTSANAGVNTYTWTTPSGLNNNQVRVKVVVTDGSAQTAEDAGDADFTIDSTKPIVTTTSPANGATNVQIGTTIAINFSETMNQALTQGAFSMSPNPGGLIYSWNGDTLTITHNNFAYGQTYTCTVSTAAKDTSDPGNS